MPSEDTTARLYNWGNIGLIFSLVLGVVSTGLVVWMGNIKEAYSQAELKNTEERTAKADLKRVELQNRIADIFGPRQLTTAQSARIGEKLVGLKGVKIDVYVLAVGNPYSADDSKDSENIAHAIVRTLRSAPAFMDAEGFLLEDCHGAGAENVVVSVPLPTSDTDKEIAGQLVDALHPEIGTDLEISEMIPYCSKFSALDPAMPGKREHGTKVSITIGRKIQPILTREMLELRGEQNEP